MDLINFQLKLCPVACQELPFINISYGTSGFRYKACYMDSIVYRVGILAALRSKYTKSITGVIVTASHNPIKDNGVKIIDYDGGSLSREWETYAVDICNTKFDDLSTFIESFASKHSIDLLFPANVLIARDTRKSGETLVDFLVWGTCVFPFTFYYNYGITTTPIIHFLVYKANHTNGIVKEKIYFDTLNQSYQEFNQMNVKIEPISVFVDCANGVGAIKLKELITKITDLSFITIKNDDVVSDLLNDKCGADYVKSNICVPNNVILSEDDLGVSFDGDADRILFFYQTKTKFTLLDGDYIAILFIHYISLNLSNIKHDLKFGFVYAAYSNSSAVRYAESKSATTVCTKTGVKYLHEEAKNFDIGVYFEANGHGTVLYSKKSFEFLTTESTKDTSISSISAKKLLSLGNLLNQTNGDALTILLSVLVILSDTHMTFKDWGNLIKPLPYSQIKVLSNKRDSLVTSNDEQTVVEPHKLQEDINDVLNKYPQSRAFLRPSGTEQAIRIFAESPDQEICDTICSKLQNLLLKYLPND